MNIEKQLARAEEIMKEKGLKITTPRVQVMRALLEHPHAHSVYALRRCDENLKKVNAVTLYRILEVFVRIGLAHRVSGNEFRACDISELGNSPKGCHLLLICDECGSVEEVHDETCREVAVAKKSGFEVFAHVNEIHGLCRDCKK